MRRVEQKAPTRDLPGRECIDGRTYGGHLVRHGSSTIDACRRDLRIAARLRELLAHHD
jgi:hypothetical protein